MKKRIYYKITKIDKEMAKNKSKGLGDSIEKITTATGIKNLVEKITKGDCGCDKRKEKLNKKFPYKK
jgi:predicted restriction endonuclease